VNRTEPSRFRSNKGGTGTAARHCVKSVRNTTGWQFRLRGLAIEPRLSSRRSLPLGALMLGIVASLAACGGNPPSPTSPGTLPSPSSPTASAVVDLRGSWSGYLNLSSAGLWGLDWSAIGDPAGGSFVGRLMGGPTASGNPRPPANAATGSFSVNLLKSGGYQVTLSFGGFPSLGGPLCTLGGTGTGNVTAHSISADVSLGWLGTCAPNVVSATVPSATLSLNR
jgi:hypothetical protein